MPRECSTLLVVVVLVLVPGMVLAGGRCEDIHFLFFDEGICANQSYNMTIMPNLLGHTSQSEASQAMPPWLSTVAVVCSNITSQFLCASYLPPCTVLEEAIPPCRELCEDAKRECSSLMDTLSYRWPKELACDQLPSQADPNSLCINATPSTVKISTAVPRTSTAAPLTSTASTLTSTAAPLTSTAAPTPSRGASPTTARPGSWPFAGGPGGALPPSVQHLLDIALDRSESLALLQEQNLRLQQQKLKLEIQLLQLKLEQY